MPAFIILFSAIVIICSIELYGRASKHIDRAQDRLLEKFESKLTTKQSRAQPEQPVAKDDWDYLSY